MCTVACGVETVVSGSFAGSGDTAPVFFAFVGVSLLRIPLAWLCAVTLDMGLMGIAWTISLTCIARATGLALWFRRGRWMKRALPLKAMRA
jgi:Na+-driven multidrug efflux pump